MFYEGEYYQSILYSSIINSLPCSLILDNVLTFWINIDSNDISIASSFQCPIPLVICTEGPHPQPTFLNQGMWVPGFGRKESTKYYMI